LRYRPLVLGIVAGVVATLIFIAGMGTAGMLVMQRLGGMMPSAGAGMGVPPGSAPRPTGQPPVVPGQPQLPGPQPPGSGPGDASALSDQEWAQQQGLPPGLPADALQMIRSRYPDGVPDEIKKQIEDLTGG
jgi:hypothetical protein